MDLDLCILDFDHCLYPGISKVAVALKITRQIAFSPKDPGDRKFLPGLLAAGSALLILRIWQKGTGKITDGDLVRHYLAWLGSIPPEYFHVVAQEVAGDLSVDVLRTVAEISNRMPVGIISLALEPVIEAVEVRLFETYGCSFAFKHCNQIWGDIEAQAAKRVLDGKDKLKYMEVEVQRLGSRRPFVVGNDLTDSLMAQRARDMGGYALGINPAEKAREWFSESIDCLAWDKVSKRIEFFLSNQSEIIESEIQS